VKAFNYVRASMLWDLYMNPGKWSIHPSRSGLVESLNSVELARFP
jgi:hypothetical protein